MKVSISVVKLMLLFVIIVGSVACGEGGGALSPTSPSALSGASGSSLQGFAPRDETRIPPIKVADGISCPSDAPIVMVGAFGTRVDIEWSPIPSVSGYEVVIERYLSDIWSQVGAAKVTGPRLEWYGQLGSRYGVRVR